MFRIFLLLGSNLDDRVSSLRAAADLIHSDVGGIERVSSIYESEPWGYTSENHFLNQLVIANTALSPKSVLDKIHHIENQLGRKRKKNGFADRTIDIDILFYGNKLVNSPELAIPHPSIENRLFALYPLSELANDFIHPKSHKTIGTLLSECTDTTRVVKIVET